MGSVFGALSGFAPLFMIPGIICIAIGCLFRKFRPSKQGSLIVGCFSIGMREWLSWVVMGIFCLAFGAILALF
jgi:hypothetical protein